VSVVLRGALLGAVVGALVAVAQTVRREDDPVDLVAQEAVKGGAQGAALGLLGGLVLAARGRHRRLAGAGSPS
jgi:hypothetical protein